MTYDIINGIQIVGVFIGFLTIVVIGKQKASENQKILLVSSICAFVSILGYTLEINSTNLDAALVAVKFGYVGKSFALTFFLMFMMVYCGIKLPQKLINGLIIFNSAILLLILTCEKHTLYYKNLHMEYDGFFPHIAFGKGVCYWLFMVVTICSVLSYMLISFSQMRKREGIEKKRLVLLSLAGAMPMFMLFLYLVGIMDFFDPTPLGVELTCTLVTLNVLKYGLLDTMQLAREEVIENTRDGLLFISPYHDLLYANNVAKKLFPELTDAHKARKKLQEIMLVNEKERVLDIDGQNYEIRISELKDSSRNQVLRGYIAWIFDMAFVNSYADEMIRLRDEAEKANVAKSSFLAHMSHEIRTPMNAIIGFSDLCIKENSQGNLAEYVTNIKTSAGTLLSLINDVLDISKIESGKMELVLVDYHLTQLFEELVSAIAPQADEKNLSFRYMVEEQIPSVLKGDKMRVREIIINLLANAIKYTREGTVLFKIKEIERDEKRIHLAILVKDSGIGIKEEDQKNIFQKFEQTDRYKNYSVEGTGLGLAIVKNLVEMMQGEISVESEYGEGSLFRAEIWQEIVDDTPIGEFRGSNLEPKQTPQKSEKIKLAFEDSKILVVDDNDINLKVAVSLLKLYGTAADIAHSGKECLDMTKKKRYDLVFMDQMMPQMDVIETMKTIRRERKNYRDVPIVVLTANALVGVRVEMLSAGFEDFLGKPIMLDEMESILLKFLKPTKMEEVEESLGQIDTKYEILQQNGIDAANGIQLCGEETIYKDVLQSFLNHSGEQLLQMEQYKQEGLYEDYTILVHGIKSAAATMGANELSGKAKEHEMAGKRGDYGFILSDFDNLKHSYEKTTQAIDEQLKHL